MLLGKGKYFEMLCDKTSLRDFFQSLSFLNITSSYKAVTQHLDAPFKNGCMKCKLNWTSVLR